MSPRARSFQMRKLWATALKLADSCEIDDAWSTTEAEICKLMQSHSHIQWVLLLVASTLYDHHAVQCSSMYLVGRVYIPFRDIYDSHDY